MLADALVPASLELPEFAAAGRTADAAAGAEPALPVLSVQPAEAFAAAMPLGSWMGISAMASRRLLMAVRLR